MIKIRKELAGQQWAATWAAKPASRRSFEPAFPPRRGASFNHFARKSIARETQAAAATGLPRQRRLGSLAYHNLELHLLRFIIAIAGTDKELGTSLVVPHQSRAATFRILINRWNRLEP